MIDTLTGCVVIVQMHSINTETGSCRSLGDTASEQRLESRTVQRWRIVPVDVHFIPRISLSASTSQLSLSRVGRSVMIESYEERWYWPLPP
jgi:hypothetical protein